MSEIAYQGNDGQVHQLNSNWVRISGLPAGSEKTHRLASLIPRSEVEGLEEAVRTVIDVAEGRITKPVLLYSNEKGLGKTHLAIGAAWMTLSKGKTVSFNQVANLLDELRCGYQISEMKPDQRGTERTYEQIMSWLQRVHLLILDDIGLNKMTDWVNEKLDQIVDYRYLNDMPLILTANSLKFSDRIVDRCKEGALIRLHGPSYRGLQSKLGGFS